MRWIIIFLFSSLNAQPDQTCHDCEYRYVVVPPSDKYCCASFFKKIIFGCNYRKEWATLVRMPVFNIRKTNFKIVEMGGGQQTTSLELIDDESREWALRSVDKDVKPPNNFTDNKFMKAVIQDHVSGAYPYAGLSVPDIANAAGVPAGNASLYFVPDDSSFDQYRSLMANKVFVLVNRQPQKEKGITTTEMLERLRADEQCYVDAIAYLRARIVDWLVADWDRHSEQWRWLERKTDSSVAFYVVPRDRDQAFYRSNGLLIKFVGLFFIPHLNKFNKNAKGIKGLSKKSWALDKQFLSSITKEDWERMIREFQKNVSDSVIESAIKKQPPEIFAIRGTKLIKRLKSRRDGLLKQVMKYYTFLSRR